jgi:multiple sugar transport system substrate-binding protein
VIDQADVVKEVERRHGPMIGLARKSTLDPRSGKYFAFSDSFVPDPGNYRIDLWTEVGFPKGPNRWEDLRVGGRRIKERFGNPVGLGLSQEVDTNMVLRALLWSFGGAEQDEKGRAVLDSRATIEALEFARALYKETETPEVFTWDPSSNNRMMLAGRASFVQNAISVTRTAERENPELARKIGLTTALEGPVRRIAAEHVMNCYVIWKFARNIDGAKQFLVDLVGEFASVFRESEFYNFPCYPTTVPDLAQQLASDPKADPPGKYTVLAGVLDWATNIGYPGYATAAMDEVFNTFVIPTMFARVAREEQTPQQAVSAAQRELERIFQKWK